MSQSKRKRKLDPDDRPLGTSWPWEARERLQGRRLGWRRTEERADAAERVAADVDRMKADALAIAAARRRRAQGLD